MFQGPGSIASIELGAIGVTGTLLNTASLASISSVRVALLLALINIFTPLLAAIIGKTTEERNVSLQAGIGCLLALASTIFAVTGDNGGLSALAGSLSMGDGEAIGAAFFYSALKVRLGSLVRNVDSEVLVSGRFIFQGLIAASIFAVSCLANHQDLGTVWENYGDPSEWAILV